MSNDGSRDYVEAFVAGRRRRIVLLGIAGGLFALGIGVLCFANPKHFGAGTVFGLGVFLAGLIVSMFGSLWHCPACNAQFRTGEWSPNFCRKCGVVLQRRFGPITQEAPVATTNHPRAKGEMPAPPNLDEHADAEEGSFPSQLQWRVMRLDDNGNHFTVAPGLSRASALEMIAQFEQSGHKQHYWFEPDSRTE